MGNYANFIIKDPRVIVTFVCIGLFAGILMGFIGIGGGVIMIPLLLKSGLSMLEAVAITLVLQTVPQGLPALIQYNKMGHVNWGKAILVVVGSTFGMTLGAYVATKQFIPENIVKKGFAVLVTLIGLSLWF